MVEDEIRPRNAYRYIKDELLMDGAPALNLASFVTTYMEDEVSVIFLAALSKPNFVHSMREFEEKFVSDAIPKPTYCVLTLCLMEFIDLEEYPACGKIETRCVNMIARLFHAPLEKPDE